MNLVKTCPDIPDNWKGGISDTAKVLGISPDTLRKYADLGKYNGGIDWRPTKAGRRVFIGKEIKRFWHDY